MVSNIVFAEGYLTTHHSGQSLVSWTVMLGQGVSILSIMTTMDGLLDSLPGSYWLCAEHRTYCGFYKGSFLVATTRCFFNTPYGIVSPLEMDGSRIIVACERLPFRPCSALGLRSASRSSPEVVTLAGESMATWGVPSPEQSPSKGLFWPDSRGRDISVLTTGIRVQVLIVQPIHQIVGINARREDSTSWWYPARVIYLRLIGDEVAVKVF
jgi:hypothetical protein